MAKEMSKYNKSKWATSLHPHNLSCTPNSARMSARAGSMNQLTFVGEVAGKHFRVLQRVFSNRNSFPPVFVGELRPQGTGTRVVGAFDLELTSKIAACLFAIVGLFVLVLVVIFSYKSRPILSSVFACAYGGILLFFPRIFRRNGLSQEKCIADFLRETLVAEEERPHSVPGNDS
jgi:hypothetical protein